MNRVLALAAVIATGCLFACQGERAGDPCDEFFQNTCKAPLSCVSVESGKVCASTCDRDIETASWKCEDPAMAPNEVEYTDSSGKSLGGAGCYCLPK